MKAINVTFDDDEINLLISKKAESGAKNWHDFILFSAGAKKKKDLKK